MKIKMKTTVRWSPHSQERSKIKRLKYPTFIFFSGGGGSWEGGIVRDFAEVMSTPLDLKWKTDRNLLYTTSQSNCGRKTRETSRKAGFEGETLKWCNWTWIRERSQPLFAVTVFNGAPQFRAQLLLWESIIIKIPLLFWCFLNSSLEKKWDWTTYEGLSQGTAMRTVKDILKTPPRTLFRRTPRRRSSPSHWRFGCFHLVDARDPAFDSILFHSTRVTRRLV